MITTYEVLEVAFGPPTAHWTNEAVTCKWGLRFNDDDGNDIHVIIHDHHPDERPPTPPGRTPDRSWLWHICGVDNEPTMKAVLARLHRESPDIGVIASMVYRSDADASEDASEGGGSGAASEE